MPALNPNTTEDTPVTETPVATETSPVKTLAKKAGKPKSAAKKDKKAVPVERRSELRNPQIKLLQALRNGKPLTRAKLTEKCPGVGLTEHLGPLNPDIKNKYTVSLLEHKFVRGESTEDQGVVYTITASGLKALERIEKAQKETK